MPSLHLNPKDLDDAAADLLQLLLKGKTDEKARATLGVPASEFARIKVHLVDQKAAELHARPTEHTYVQYIFDQLRNIQELTELIRELRKKEQYASAIRAIQLRADLRDRILARGQDCGVIHKQADRKEIVAGVLVADLSNRQLRSQLRTELDSVNRMISAQGDKPFIDVETGPIHYGPAAEAVEEAAAIEAPLLSRRKKKKKKKKQRMVEG